MAATLTINIKQGKKKKKKYSGTEQHSNASHFPSQQFLLNSLQTRGVVGGWVCKDVHMYIRLRDSFLLHDSWLSERPVGMCPCPRKPSWFYLQRNVLKNWCGKKGLCGSGVGAGSHGCPRLQSQLQHLKVKAALCILTEPKPMQLTALQIFRIYF